MIAPVTSTPVLFTSNQSTLLVENNTNTWITIGSGATSYGGILFGDSGASDIGQIRYNHNGNNLEFHTSSGERLRIDSSGRVGIGCIPTAQFNHNLIQIGNQATLGANAALSTTGQTFLTHNLYFDPSGNYQVFNTSSANEGTILRMVDGNFTFSNSAATTGTPTVTERMRITSGGSVGIGTVSPSAKFEVVDGTTSISFNKTSSTPRIDFKGNSVAELCQIKAAESVGGGVLQFFTKTTGGTATERIRIDTSGNVGVGVTSIQERFHVANAGNCNITSQCTATGSGANAAVQVKSSAGGDYLIQTGNAVSGGLRVYDGGASATRVLLDSSGNVGIGLTPSSGQGVLQLNGGLRIAGSANASDTSGPFIFRTSGSDNMVFATSGSERMRITSSGLIGIHAGSNTGALIDIQGNSEYNNHIRLRSYQGGAVVEHWNGRGISDNSDTGRLGVGKNGNALIYTSASANPINAFAIGNSDAKPLIFSTGNAEKVRVDGGSTPALFVGQTSANADGNGWTLQGAIQTSSVKFTSTDVRTMFFMSSYHSTGSQDTKFAFHSNGTMNATNTTIQAFSSERRTKKNIVALNLEKAWNTLRDTPFYTFNFKDEIEGTRLHHGPIVDECPEDLIVPTQKEDEVGIINTVNTEKLQYRAYSALQQALKRIEELETKVAALEAA